MLFYRGFCPDIEALHFKAIALCVVICLSTFGLTGLQNSPTGYYDEYGSYRNDLSSGSQYVIVGDSRKEIPPQNSVPIQSFESICRRSDLFCFPSTLSSSEANFSGFSGIKPDETVVVGSMQPMGNLSWSINRGNFQLASGNIVSCSLELKESAPDNTSDENDTPSCRNSSFDWKLNPKEESVRIKSSHVNDSSSPNVQISHPLVDWGQKYLHFPSLAFLTVENRHNYNVLKVFEPYSTNSQFYPCNNSEIVVGPGETVSICLVFSPRWLGLSSAHIILQTSLGGFLIQAQGYGVESPYAIHSSVGLNHSSSGKWSKVVSLFNPSDKVLHLKEASVWVSFSSGNVLYSVKGVCNVMDQKGVSERSVKEWLDVKIGQLGQPIIAIRPHKTWSVGSNSKEPILELEFPHRSQDNIFGSSCVQLLNGSQDPIFLEAEFGGRSDLSVSLDVLAPCDANGVTSVSLLVENNGHDVVTVVKISEVGANLRTKYVEGLILFPRTVTQVATVTYTPDQYVNFNCKLFVQTNKSNSPELEVSCSEIANLCSQSYLGYGMFSYGYEDTRSAHVHAQPLLDIKATEMTKADESVLGNWRSQGTDNRMSVLDKNEVTFPVVHIGSHQSKWISVVNPSDRPVVMQLLLNSGEIINKCRGSDEYLQPSIFYTLVLNSNMIPSRYGFSIAGNALTEAHVHPYEKAVLGPIMFHPSSRCEWKSSVLIRNNLSGVEWVSLRGSGGMISLILLDGSDPVHTVEFKHKHGQPHTKVLFAKNTGDLPVEVNSILVSGTKCKLDGFVVVSCKGFIVKPGEYHELTLSYRADTCAEIVRRELELGMDGGILVMPMEVRLSTQRLAICKRILLWTILKKFVLMVLVFVLIVSMACSFSFIIRGPYSDVCSKLTVRELARSSSSPPPPPSCLVSKCIVVEESKTENLTVKTGKNKARRRTKKRGSSSETGLMVGLFEVSSSQSSNSSPSSPSSPLPSFTSKKSPNLSSKQNFRARSPFSPGSTSVAPPAKEKPCTPPKTTVPFNRAPGPPKRPVSDARFEYNIWDSHIQLPAGSEVGSVVPTVAEDNKSVSFFANNPKEFFTSYQADTVSSKQDG